MDQWDRPTQYNQLIFDKGAKINSMEEGQSFQQIEWSNRTSIKKQNK